MTVHGCTVLYQQQMNRWKILLLTVNQWYTKMSNAVSFQQWHVCLLTVLMARVVTISY